MVDYIAIPIAFLVLLGLTIIRGRYEKAGIGEIPLLYQSVVIQFFLNISFLLFLGLSLFLLFYKWKLFLMLLATGFLIEALVIVPIIEKVLFLITHAHSKIPAELGKSK